MSELTEILNKCMREPKSPVSGWLCDAVGILAAKVEALDREMLCPKCEAELDGVKESELLARVEALEKFEANTHNGYALQGSEIATIRGRVEALEQRQGETHNAYAAWLGLSDAADSGGPKREPARPRIVCLCGSTRFFEAFQEAPLKETVAGKIVLSIGCNLRSDNQLWADPSERAAIKIRLDELHKRKIDLADEVLVLNIGGYIGGSTRSEIDYALAHGKPVRYLEEEPLQPAPLRVPADPTRDLDREAAERIVAAAKGIPPERQCECGHIYRGHFDSESGGLHGCMVCDCWEFIESPEPIPAQPAQPGHETQCPECSGKGTVFAFPVQPAAPDAGTQEAIAAGSVDKLKQYVLSAWVEAEAVCVAATDTGPSEVMMVFKARDLLREVLGVLNAQPAALLTGHAARLAHFTRKGAGASLAMRQTR